MSEYISREEAVKALRTHISITISSEHDLTPYEKEINELGRGIYDAQKAAIDSIPTADVRPNIHGYWEPKYPTREEMIYCQERYFCSNCKNYIVDRIARLEFNFCPNCGADMREPKGEKGE